MKRHKKRVLKKTLFFVLLVLAGANLAYSRVPEIPKDILIEAIVEPWLYFEVSPLTLLLSPDLVSREGVFNIGETPEISLQVGTSNPGGWEIKIKGKNNGLKSQITNYVISTVNGTSTLVPGVDGYGAQATSTLEGAIVNLLYDFFDTNTVGEIVTDWRTLVLKTSPNSLSEVAKMKIKATASVMAPAGDYTDEIILTIIALI